MPPEARSGILGGPAGRVARGGKVDATAGRIAERGTDVAFQAILAAMRDDPSEDAAKETAKNTKDAADLLVNIDENLAGVDIGGA